MSRLFPLEFKTLQPATLLALNPILVRLDSVADPQNGYYTWTAEDSPFEARKTPMSRSHLSTRYF